MVQQYLVHQKKKGKKEEKKKKSMEITITV